MRKYLFLILIAIFFIGCKANTDLPETNNTESESGSRDTTTNQTKNYPKLKVENNKTNGDFIFLIELPDYNIEPVEIRGGESMTFELYRGLVCYENVTIHLRYGGTRKSFNDVYVRKNFADGQTTTVTLE